MECPICLNDQTKVVDSREVDDGTVIRRRRECLKCHARFSTLEELEILDLKVIKKNNRIESYDVQKIEEGIRLAFTKRPFLESDLQKLMNRIERKIIKNTQDGRIKTDKIGDIVLSELMGIDIVAYIRFASVCRSFDSLESFRAELKRFNKPKI